MPYDALLIHTVTLFSPDDTSEGDDYTRYGDQETNYPLVGTESPGLVQQNSSTEDIIDRDTRITSYTLFLPVTAPVSALSYWTWEDEDRRFTVQGRPEVVNDGTGPHHIEVLGREVEG